MKKILLIGKNGQLGSEIIKDASSFGFDIAGFEKEELDITDKLRIKERIEEIKPDILINTSAYHVLPMCEKNPLAAMAVNFIAVLNLADICKKNNVVFMTFSTDYVFDGKKKRPYEEDDIANPLQIYGLSKLAGEYAALNKGAYIIRTCGLYGGRKGSPEKGGNFVLNIINEAQGKKNIEVSSELIISPTYAGDLSKAVLKLLNSKAESGIFHLVNEGYCSWHEFAKEIFQLAKINKEINPIDRSGYSEGIIRPRFSALKNKKAKSLGIELPTWQDGLKSYFDFLN